MLNFLAFWIDSLFIDKNEKSIYHIPIRESRVE